MRLKIFLLTLIALFTLAACSPSATVSNPPQPNTLSVSDSGSAKATPDIATVNIGVVTRNEDVAKAVSENNGKMNAIMAAVKELSVEAKDVQTVNFSIHAEQQFDRTGKVISITYVASNTVNIIVRDLNKVGDVLGKTVAGGANNINGVTFGVSDPEKLQTQAREKAMANAKAKAEQMAKLAGVSLDKPMSISENIYEAVPQPVARNFAAAQAADVSPVPVSGGQLEVMIQVNIVYVIK